MPRLLRGARLMSTMSAFLGSFGSTSPVARPTSFSYGPTWPNDMPSKVGDSVREMTSDVIRA